MTIDEQVVRAVEILYEPIFRDLERRMAALEETQREQFTALSRRVRALDGAPPASKGVEPDPLARCCDNQRLAEGEVYLHCRNCGKFNRRETHG